jgi:hypothetical protein
MLPPKLIPNDHLDASEGHSDPETLNNPAMQRGSEGIGEDVCGDFHVRNFSMITGNASRGDYAITGFPQLLPITGFGCSNGCPV